MTEYVPEYAPGEVIIQIDPVPDPQAGGRVSMDYLLGLLHGSISPTISLRRDSFYSDSGSAYIVSVPVGEEDEYCKRLETVDIVESAYQRDLRFERRYTSLDDLASRITGIKDHVEIPSEAYNLYIDQLADAIEKCRD